MDLLKLLFRNLTFSEQYSIIIINLRIMGFRAYCKPAYSGINKQTKTCVLWK